jgi:hypothetical protein
MNDNRMAVALVRGRAEADRVLHDLKLVGIPPVDLSVFSPADGASLAVALRACGVTDAKASMYDDKVRTGATLVMIHTALGKDVGEARRILALHGGYEISVTVVPKKPADAATTPN